MSVEASSSQTNPDAKTAIAFNRTIDWAIGAILVTVGILLALGGATVYYSVTRLDVADLIHSSEFQSDVLTEAETIDALIGLSQWSGIGFAVTSGLLVLLGIAVVIAHGRARHDDRRTPGWILGVVGALVGSVLSFIPFSPILGGAAAGYLDPNRKASGFGTGILAGIFASLPLLLVAVFAGVGLFVNAPSKMMAAVLTFIGITVFLILPYFVGLSALGGYLGGWIRNR